MAPVNPCGVAAEHAVGSEPGGGRTVRTRPRPTCPLCGQPGRVRHERLRDLLYGVDGLWTLRECPSAGCGLMWLDPIPVPEDVPLLYVRYYTHRAAAGHRTSLRDSLYKVYRGAHSILAGFTGLGREIRLIRGAGLEDLPAGKVFDVGCGDGVFLQAMRMRGWEVEGCEVDAGAAGLAREKGLVVHTGDFAALDLPQGAYDAVTLHHVVEHLPDARPVFEKARQMLRPGGRLVIVTPNTRSLGHDRFGRCWRGLEPPRHFCLYHPDLLARLAREGGYGIRLCLSSAAHADVILGASLSLAEARGRPVWDPPPVSFVRTLRALALQLAEHQLIRKGHSRGEECLLVAEKL